MSQTESFAIANDTDAVWYSPIAAEIAHIKMSDIPDGRKRALIKAVLNRQILEGKRGGGRH